VRVGPASECIYLEWKSSLGVGQLGGDSHLRLVSYVSLKWPVIWASFLWGIGLFLVLLLQFRLQNSFNMI